MYVFSAVNILNPANLYTCSASLDCVVLVEIKTANYIVKIKIPPPSKSLKKWTWLCLNVSRKSCSGFFFFLVLLLLTSSVETTATEKKWIFLVGDWIPVLCCLFSAVLAHCLFHGSRRTEKCSLAERCLCFPLQGFLLSCHFSELS